jgi:hypothetical protein
VAVRLVLRAIPRALFANQPESYYDVEDLTPEQVQELKAEIERNHCVPQDLWLEDPTQMLVNRRVRLELEAEREK